MEKEKQQPNKRKAGNPQWQKGVSGNPNGRPKKIISLTTEMKAQLALPCPLDPNKRTWLQYLTEKWLYAAASNPTYFKELIERLEGKVPQELTGEGGGPIIAKIEVVSERARELTEAIMKGKPTGES